jgi:hypothetical protein
LNQMRRLTEFRDRRRHGRGSWRSLTAVVCAGAFVTLAQASDPIDNSPSDSPSLVVRPSDIAAGKLVQSPEGMVIGTVHDVLREPASGRPAYIVIATDSGFKAIPSYAIGHLLRDAHIVIDRSTLAGAPQIPGNEEPKGDKDAAAPWRQQADSYWSGYR